MPGIISWPEGFKRNGVQPGGVSAEPIIGSDIFPTFLEIAGIDLPENVTLDATSILPILENWDFERTRLLYWRNAYYDYRIALREDDWKIIGRSDHTSFELYNLVADPRETTDLSAHEPERFEHLKQTLIEYDNAVLKEGADWWKMDRMSEGMPSNL